MTRIIHYLLNIKEELKEKNADLSYPRIQLVICSLWINLELNRDGATPENVKGIRT